MKQPKYFYLTTQLDLRSWLDNGCLKVGTIHHVGSKWWPHTRQEAREVPPQSAVGWPMRIYQFENKPPYKFVKQVW